MKPYRIEVNDNIDETIKNIVSDYWCIIDNEFKYSLTVLSKKYSLKQQKITQIVKENSICLVEEICSVCQVTIQRKVETKGYFKTSKGYFKTSIYTNIICSDCESERRKMKEENERIRIENQKKNLEKLRLEKLSKFQTAIDKKNWLKLNDFEFDILEKIIKHNNFRSIKGVVFKGDDNDNNIWSAFDKLDELGLIYLIKERWNNDIVKDIEFDSRLLDYIERPKTSKVVDYLSFSLIKKEKKTVKQPDYSGIFTLPTDIILKAGVKYLYGGWIQTDNSINLKFTPIENVFPVVQTDIENEPRVVKDILGDMFTKIRQNDEEEECPPF